jgi:hypothetical protein
MTVMRWLAVPVIILGSLGAAVAQDTASKPPRGPDDTGSKSELGGRASQWRRSRAGRGRRPGTPAATDDHILGLPRLRVATAEIRIQCREDGIVRCDLAAAGLDGSARRNGSRRPHHDRHGNQLRR